MKLFNPFLAAVLLALLHPTLARADESLTLTNLSLGENIRLRLSSGGKIQGALDSVGPDGIVVRPRDLAKPPLRLTPQEMTRLEVARGRRSHWRGGALVGFVPGALLLTAFAEAMDECYRDCDHTNTVKAALVGGAITGTVGGLIGLAIKTDRWVPVATTRPGVKLSLSPIKGGFRAKLSLRF